MSNNPATPNQSPTLARDFKMLTPPLKSRRLSSPVRLGPNTRSSPNRRPNILASPDRPPPVNDALRTPLNRVTRSSPDMRTVTRSADRLSHLLNTPEPVVAPVFQPSSLKRSRSRSRSRSHPGGDPDSGSGSNSNSNPNSNPESASGSPSDSSPIKLRSSARKIMSPSKSLAYPRLPTTPRVLLSSSPNARSQLSTPSFDATNLTPRRVFKAPQFLSPAKRSFDEISHSSEGVSEISFQLKNKLSSALDKINKASIKAPDLRFNPFTLSPTTTSDRLSRLSDQNVPRYDPTAERAPSPTLLKGANFNLQTLEQSQASPVVSPIWEQNYARKLVPSDSPSSAHDALIAALRRNRRSHSSSASPATPNTPSSPPTSLQSVAPKPPSTGESHMVSGRARPRPSLGPSLDTNSGEQDAVLSLMSLSSPCKRRRDSSSTRNSFSRASSSSSLALAGPSPTQSHHNQDSAGSDITIDDDETDVESQSDTLQQ